MSEREPSAATDPAGPDRRGVLVGTGAPSRSESAAPVTLSDTDPRWQATLAYTTADDGVWLEYEGQRRLLGFFATLEDALFAAMDFEPSGPPSSA